MCKDGSCGTTTQDNAEAKGMIDQFIENQSPRERLDTLHHLAGIIAAEFGDQALELVEGLGEELSAKRRDKFAKSVRSLLQTATKMAMAIAACDAVAEQVPEYTATVAALKDLHSKAKVEVEPTYMQPTPNGEPAFV